MFLIAFLVSLTIMLAMSLVEYLGSLGLLLAILCPLCVVLTGFFTKSITSAWGKRIVSWILPLAFCLASYFFHLNTFLDNMSLGYVIATGIFIGLVNNGIYSIDQIKDMIKSLTGQN